MLQLLHKAQPFVTQEEILRQQKLIDVAHTWVHEQTGEGHDFLGWVDLPSTYDKTEFARIQAAGKRIADTSTLLVVIGIGGSYLGARAALSFLQNAFTELLPSDQKPVQIVFAGHQMSSTYMHDLLALLDRHEVSVNVISKSGTTTEPALAFRFLEEYMVKRYGKEEAAKRIYATTDKARGALRTLSDQNGYETFVIPDDVGGRFSVLTPVGLLPLAAAGVAIDRLMLGAQKAQQDLANPDLTVNPAYEYAALRTILREKGKQIEMLVSYEPSLHYIGEWWKQLFGESEGKDHKGLFPAAADFSTDLHSLGQYVQDGARILFETVLQVKKVRHEVVVTEQAGNLDGLNYLAGKNLQEVNDTALLATRLAHTEGGVPNIVIELEDMQEETLGYLFYFFEKTVAISGYLLGVNPFDQPGVEAYKVNMFALLGKPGYEDVRATLLK